MKNHLTKLYEKCNLKMVLSSWDRHLKTKTHLQNDPDKTIKPGISGRLRLFNNPMKEYDKCKVEVIPYL
jgi:hypothetical protein